MSSTGFDADKYAERQLQKSVLSGTQQGLEE